MKKPSARSVERAIRAAEEIAAARTLPDCPLCGRSISPDAKSSRHHLTPRLKGGTHMGTVRLHQICHSAIHARYSESEIAQHLNDVESLQADPEIMKFVAWVRTKPPGFHEPTRLTRARR